VANWLLVLTPAGIGAPASFHSSIPSSVARNRRFSLEPEARGRHHCYMCACGSRWRLKSDPYPPPPDCAATDAGGGSGGGHASTGTGFTESQGLSGSYALSYRAQFAGRAMPSSERDSCVRLFLLFLFVGEEAGQWKKVRVEGWCSFRRPAAGCAVVELLFNLFPVLSS
jgi:hypothetical protein